MLYAAFLVVLLVVAGLFLLTRSRRDQKGNTRPVTASNVISMDGHRKARQSSGEQICSSCRKKNGKLIFYAQDNGSVVGLCRDCKSKARKKDMLPL